MAARAEILSPAGDMEKLKLALLYGADAVYMAGKSFGMRAAAGNFNNEELKNAVSLCHQKDIRAYITCNIIPGEDDLKLLPQFLEYLQEIGADAVIITDLGVLSLESSALAACPHKHAGGDYELETATDKRRGPPGLFCPGAGPDSIASIRAKTPKSLEIETLSTAQCVSISGAAFGQTIWLQDANRGDAPSPVAGSTI